MNKKKIIFINIFLFILVLILAEFFVYFKETSVFNKRPAYSLYKENYEIKKLKENMRKPTGLEYKKSPVLIYGCSYGYGFALDEKYTFGYKLSKYAKRPVYNFSMSSKGLQDALYLIKNDEKIIPEPEYIFYVFINDHVRRMFVNCNKIDNVNYLTYKNKNGVLAENFNNFDISERFYLTREIKNVSYYFYKNIFKKQIFDLTKLYFVSIKNEIENKYPNAKFIVLDYENGKENYLNDEKVKILEKEGIEVLNLNKVFNNKLKADKYRNDIKEDSFRHPNGKAWDIIVKYLIEKYNL